ncbi:MAG: DUF1990 family protein [Taibaiella sp.]|nr:DUF1990 family protein [Taibaiella sp.]
MKIYLKNQARQFDKHLEVLRNKKVQHYDKKKLLEKTTSINIYTNKSLQELDFSFFFNYHIFPANILVAKTLWAAEKRNMKVGDTIVQQIFLPLKSFNLKVIFGVRISEVINENNLKQFSYETLEGHVEQGISSFSITADDGIIKFSIHTYSQPGNWLTRLLGPIVTLPYQAYCTRQALVHVKKQLEQQ